MIALDNSNYYGVPFIGRATDQQTAAESPQSVVDYGEKQDNLTSS